MRRVLLLVGMLVITLVGFTVLVNRQPNTQQNATLTLPAQTTTTTKTMFELKRSEKIPTTAVKITPEADVYPPILYSSEWNEPVPLTPQINTAGAEDSPFITPDGNTLYFFFTPDMNIPVEKQLTDTVTGIWYSTWTVEGWTEAKRLDLYGNPSMDGAECLVGDQLWFASARIGNYRGVDFWIATLTGNVASNVRNAGKRLNSEIQVGELHVSAGGKTIYFDRPADAGGMGGTDIWMTHLVDGSWSDPENVADVNSDGDDSRPFLSQDGNELWITRTYKGTPAIYRSMKTAAGWTTPELIISQVAGEPSLDSKGNIYFVHHFMKGGQFLGADIYVAYRR